jgi:hypothetical protein
MSGNTPPLLHNPSKCILQGKQYLTLKRRPQYPPKRWHLTTRRRVPEDGSVELNQIHSFTLSVFFSPHSKTILLSKSSNIKSFPLYRFFRLQ